MEHDRTRGDGLCSYFVDGEKITNTLGFRPERGVTQATLEMWDALERGEFGHEPENDPGYFKVRYQIEVWVDS